MSSAPITEPPPALPAPATHAALAPPDSDGGKGGTVRKILVVVVIAAAVGAAVWKIRSNNAAQATSTTRLNAAADRPIPVLAVPVQLKTMPIYLTALGTVTPYNSVTIKSRVDGQLMSVAVREGQSVRKGQALAQIDPRPYEATLAQAKGQLVKDQATAKNADAEAQRYTALYNAGVVSRESQQTQVTSAGQSAGSLDADQAAIQAADVNLNYTRITSPIDGVVGLRLVDPGNIVHASDASGLLLVTQLQPITVIFTLPEDQLPEVLKLVRSGKKLAVEAYDRSETTHLASGTVLTLDNQIDSTTGTDKVKAVFPNKDGALFPNQFVNVRLILEQRQNALVVPASAIQTGSQGTFVYVVKKGNPPNTPGGAAGGGGGRRGGGNRGAGGGAAAAGTAAANAPAAGPATSAGSGAVAGPGSGAGGGRGAGGPGQPPADPHYVVSQPVVVDVTQGTQVILASGVNPGDQVVIDGQEKLLPGSKVSPRAQEGTGAGRSGPGGASSDGTGTAASGRGGAGPSEPGSNPGKRGLESGTGIHPGGGRGSHAPGSSPSGAPQTGPSQSGQPHPHRRPGGGAGGQTGQQP